MRTQLEMNSSQWPEIWQAAYRLLEQEIVEAQLKAWIEPLEWLDATQTDQGITVRLGSPNDFSSGWVKDHYLKTIESALTRVTGSECKIDFIINRTAGDRQMEPFQSVKPGAQAGSERGGTAFEDRKIHDSLMEPDPRFTFDSFVVGASNQFAHASAVAVSEKPAEQYNPLFLYSSPGLGKTHLLHAIGNHLKAKNPSFRVGYISAESFVNEMIESLQHQKMPQFRRKYRDSFDALLIDDIQFIAGKKQTEEEFFHTFNALYGSKRQIVLTSDRPPKEIEKLEERIRTRFEWGLVADIQVPEIETRIAILKAKAERDDIYLPEEVAIFLASHVKTNVRELEGILIRLQAQASLTGAEITLEMAKHQLQISNPEEGSHLTIESIQNVVAKHYGLKIADLKSANRAKTVTMPRQIAMYLTRKYTGMGFKEIGQYFGGKDHTTILHACQKIEKSFDADQELREEVEKIQNLL